MTKLLSLTVPSAPAVEPISLTEAKAYLKVDTTADNDFITGLIQAAREEVETYTSKRLVTQTIVEYFECFPRSTWFILAASPVQSVTSIQYYDTDNVLQTMSSGDYLLDGNSTPARIGLDLDATWPSTASRLKAVTVTYVAGYGNAAAVPLRIKEAMYLIIADWYDNRTDPVRSLPQASQRILDKVKETYFYG